MVGHSHQRRTGGERWDYPGRLYRARRARRPWAQPHEWSGAGWHHGTVPVGRSIHTEPGNTQNYNRYSYVNNNPLSFTDPSGFSSTPRPISRPRDATPTDIRDDIETVEVPGLRDWLPAPYYGL